MAIIVLQNADFSANNIGTIDIPKPFSNLTKQILGRYKIEIDENDSFQKSFNSFILSLDNSGLIGSKIMSLCLPFMANITQSGSLQYAQMNALTGDNFFDENVYGSLILERGGLKPVIDQPVRKIKMVGLGITATNCSYACYNSTPETVYVESDDPNTNFVFGENGTTNGLCKCRKGRPRFYYKAGGEISGDSNYTSVPCPMVGIARMDNVSLICNGQITTSTVTYQIGTDKDPIFGSISGTSYNYNSLGFYPTEAAWSFLSIGTSMSDQEAALYCDKINSLMEAARPYLI